MSSLVRAQAEEHDETQMVLARLAELQAARAHPFVHYDPATGWLKQWSTRPFAIEGLAVAEIEPGPPDADGHSHKVDLASVEPGAFGWDVCRLIEHPPGEGPSASQGNLDALLDDPYAQALRNIGKKL
jgi:hypothetical protein